MENTYPKVLASSQDPTKLSLSVTSATQVILYMVAFFAVHKGLDPNAATTQVQGLIDLGVTMLPLIMALYHSVQLAFGLVRKLLALLKTPTPTV